MSKIQTRSLVEGALLSALTIILSISSVYIPFIGIFLTFLWPVPIIILCIRHGIKISIMATIVAGLIVAMLTEPLQAFTIILGFGLIGITLGYAFRKHLSPGKTLLFGTTASILSKIILFGITMVVLDINPLTANIQMFRESVDSVVNFYSGVGMNKEQLMEIQQNFENMFKLIPIMIPGVLVMASFFDAFINFSVARIVLKKLGNEVRGFPPLKHWQMPVYSVPLFLLGVAATLIFRYYPYPVFKYLGINLQLIFSLILMLQGLAVTSYYLNRFNVNKLLTTVIFVFIIFNPFFSQIAVWVGIFDLLFDFRKLHQDNIS